LFYNLFKEKNVKKFNRSLAQSALKDELNDSQPFKVLSEQSWIRYIIINNFEKFGIITIKDF